MPFNSFDVRGVKIHEFLESSLLFTTLYDNVINDLLEGISILPGGNTPKGFYDLLSKRGVSNLEYILSDDRLVPNDNTSSNFKNIVDCISRGSKSVLPMSYYDELQLGNLGALNRKLHSIKGRISLGILGLGSDSHTASLFPNQSLTMNDEQCGFIVKNSNENFERFTLGYDYLLSAKKIIFLVLGDDKAIALNSTLLGAYNPIKYPAQKIINCHDDIEIYCDSSSSFLIKNNIL